MLKGEAYLKNTLGFMEESFDGRQRDKPLGFQNPKANLSEEED